MGTGSTGLVEGGRSNPLMVSLSNHERIEIDFARGPVVEQDDCKVFSNPFMASLSNHRQLEQASFDKLRMSRHQWAALLCNRPGRRRQGYRI